MNIIKRSFVLLMIVVACSALAFGQFQQQTQGAQAKPVSDQELDVFIKAFNDVQAINAKIQQRMVEVLTENDLDVQRFNEVQQMQQAGNRDIDMTPEEAKNFENAGKAIGEIQVEAQKEMESKIQENGITLQRYQEISMQVQQDHELREKFQTKVNR